MKTYYLDTNIYNKIYASDKTAVFLNAVKARGLRVTASALNLEELAYTQDVQKRNDLLGLLKIIADNRMLDEHSEILKRDLDSFLQSGGQSNNIWNSEGISYYVELIQNEKYFLDKDINEVHRQAKDKKKKYKKIMNQHQKRDAEMWKPHKGKITVDEFIDKSFKDNQILTGICSRVYGLDNAESLAELVLQNIAKMHRLRRLLKYSFIYIYDMLANPESSEPKWGDDYDMLHSMYLGCCDVYVTDDEGFYKITSRFNEEYFEVLKYDQFVGSVLS